MKIFFLSLTVILLSFLFSNCSSANINTPSGQSAIQMMRFDHPNFDEPFQL